MRYLRLLTTAALVLGSMAGARSAEGDAVLAKQSYDLLKKYCYECHGATFKKPPLNVLDRDVLLKAGDPYLVPGKPDESYLYDRLTSDMPPKNKPQPTDAEKAVLKKWIVAGAPFPAAGKRGFLGERHILTAIRGHMRGLTHEDRPFQRYFTLTHLHGNGNVNAADLRLYRAGLSKIVNSLHWRPNVVVPQPIDREETVYNVDLRRLGWGGNYLWRELIRSYPYGLRHDTDADVELRELYRDVTDMTNCELPYLRADWMTYAAARPPLYHTMLRLPNDLGSLERQLNVSLAANFRDNTLIRAGMAQSGVSRHNRLVERHPSLHGSYWRSYDFASSAGRGDLLRFPLGPDLPSNAHAARHGFKQAGGEVIFSLPNRLHGYMLANSKDQRIDKAPIEIVRDGEETSGTPEVVNGASCMSCHRHGIKDGFKDVVRTGTGLSGPGLVKLQQLYRPASEMNDLLKQDKADYMAALERATGRFLKTGDHKDKDLAEFPDPVGEVSKMYLRDLDAEDVAAELGLKNGDVMKTFVVHNRSLRRMGLGHLKDGHKIKRDVWDRVSLTSQFQDVACALELGTPHVELKGGRTYGYAK